MQILAHRGWWLAAEEKNSVAAFSRAFAAGYGVETDLRDHEGQIVIAHDMPMGRDHLSFDAFIDIYMSHGAPGWLALNIKADGLHGLVTECLERNGISNAFVFDMAVPDAIGYFRNKVVTYTRHSEYEPVPPFYTEAHGVWLDAFNSDWFGADTWRDHLKNGKSVALVSPELHKRPHEAVWETWCGHDHPQLFICTDLPDEADRVFNSKHKDVSGRTAK